MPWARRGFFPRWRRIVTCRARCRRPIHAYQTPSLAILLTGALTACAALFLRFQSLIDLANLVVVLQYAATCTALI